MKVLILAGGLGTRLSEETSVVPKPMVEIGGRPIIWHIMKTYSHYGFNEFVVLLGYRGYVVKEFFVNYPLHQSTLTVDLAKNEMQVHSNESEPWKVTLVDTGRDTMTGGRILAAREYVDNQPFLLTYGDGLADINLQDLLDFHRRHSGLVTMTSVQPEGRYGSIDSAKDGRVDQFVEKPPGESGWVNGGFFVCDPGVFDYIEGPATHFERSPLERLAADGKLFAYKHRTFWKCMDTLRDKLALEKMWQDGRAPWRTWE